MVATTTALLIGALATTGAGTVMQARAARKGGQAAQAAANDDALLSEYNASIAEIQAQDARERGDVEANHYRQQVRGMVGAQRASFGAQGVDVNSGTPLALQADTTAMGELDALQIQNNAKREAWGYDVEAYDSKMRALFARREGVMLAKAGNANATAAVIQGAGSMLGTGFSYAAMRYGFPTSPAGQATYRGDALLPSAPRA